MTTTTIDQLARLADKYAPASQRLAFVRDVGALIAIALLECTGSEDGAEYDAK